MCYIKRKGISLSKGQTGKQDHQQNGMVNFETAVYSVDLKLTVCRVKGCPQH